MCKNNLNYITFTHFLIIIKIFFKVNYKDLMELLLKKYDFNQKKYKFLLYNILKCYIRLMYEL